MNEYKVGCNFDWKLLDAVQELNEKYAGKARIIELFGSDSTHE